MIQEFTYNNKKRRVAVIQQTSLHLSGIDLGYLSESVAQEVEEFFKDYVPTSEKVEIEGYKKEWNVGWRKFKKENCK